MPCPPPYRVLIIVLVAPARATDVELAFHETPSGRVVDDDFDELVRGVLSDESAHVQHMLGDKRLELLIPCCSQCTFARGQA